MPEPFVSTTSRVIEIPRANIDTDQICPARFLKITDKAGLADALFCDWRFTPDGKRREPPFLIDEPANAGRQILLVGDNFGAGSSREHAPWALRAWGIRAIVSTGFADIFRGNALKNALLPIVVSAERHTALAALVAADPDGMWTVDLEAERVTLPGGQSFAFEIDPFARTMILAGTDEIGYVRSRLPAIEAWEAVHPARVDTRAGAPTR
ncbi:MAG: 3-isopropylmalate dehydratase small subunit [Candidatus Limnocylindrales bacterium]|jgi:3-isopropylmalate/(R)-2-methylmalate dehydratase small subunit